MTDQKDTVDLCAVDLGALAKVGGWIRGSRPGLPRSFRPAAGSWRPSWVGGWGDKSHSVTPWPSALPPVGGGPRGPGCGGVLSDAPMPWPSALPPVGGGPRRPWCGGVLSDAVMPWPSTLPPVGTGLGALVSACLYVISYFGHASLPSAEGFGALDRAFGYVFTYLCHAVALRAPSCPWLVSAPLLGVVSESLSHAVALRDPSRGQAGLGALVAEVC